MERWNKDLRAVLAVSFEAVILRLRRNRALKAPPVGFPNAEMDDDE